MIFVPQFFHSLMEWGEGAPPRKKKEKGRKDEDQGENPEAKELRGILCSLFWCWQCVFWLVCCGEFCPLLFECCLKELSKRLTKSGQICWQRNLGSCPKKDTVAEGFCLKSNVADLFFRRVKMVRRCQRKWWCKRSSSVKRSLIILVNNPPKGGLISKAGTGGICPIRFPINIFVKCALIKVPQLFDCFCWWK